MKQMRKSARDETDKMKKEEVDLRRQSDACRKQRCLICNEEDVCDPEMIAIDESECWKMLNIVRDMVYRMTEKTQFKGSCFQR